MSRAWGNGSTRAWRQLRAWVLARDNHQCQIRLPGCTGHATHVDHIITKADDGLDIPENLRAACQPCNLGRRTAHTPQPAPTPRTRW